MEWHMWRYATLLGWIWRFLKKLSNKQPSVWRTEAYVTQCHIFVMDWKHFYIRMWRYHLPYIYIFFLRSLLTRHLDINTRLSLVLQSLIHVRTAESYSDNFDIIGLLEVLIRILCHHLLPCYVIHAELLLATQERICTHDVRFVGRGQVNF